MYKPSFVHFLIYIRPRLRLEFQDIHTTGYNQDSLTKLMHVDV